MTIVGRIGPQEEFRAIYTKATFSMNGRSSAPNRVGSLLVPQAAQYFARWIDRDDRSYVTLMVNTAIVEAMVAKVCRMHPSVRCIAREEVVPSPSGSESSTA